MGPEFLERRLLYRQGTLLLLLSALLGLVVAAQPPHPGKWMAAHVGGLMTGILVISLGALWPEVRLRDGTRRRALQMGLTAAWLGVVANVYGALVNLPGPATDPGRQPDAPWQLPILFVMLAVIVPTTLGSFFLVWKGLRG
jgi:hydroxylaminobenzene mutase